MPRNKVIDADAAARVLLDGDTVAVGGFVGATSANRRRRKRRTAPVGARSSAAR